MDKDKLIEQLKAQNKLLRREGQAAEKMDGALQKWLADHKEQSYDKYVRARDAWFAAVAARSVRYPGQYGKPQEGVLLAVHGDGAYVSTPAHAPVLVPTRDVEVLSGLVQVSLTKERENGLA